MQAPHDPPDGQRVLSFSTSEQDAVETVLVDTESPLAPFEARPHWGKVFLADAAAIAPLYQRLPDFTRLAERLDPRGAFHNSWLQSHVLSDAWRPGTLPDRRD